MTSRPAAKPQSGNGTGGPLEFSPDPSSGEKRVAVTFDSLVLSSLRLRAFARTPECMDAARSLCLGIARRQAGVPCLARRPTARAAQRGRFALPV